MRRLLAVSVFCVCLSCNALSDFFNKVGNSYATPGVPPDCYATQFTFSCDGTVYDLKCTQAINHHDGIAVCGVDEPDAEKQFGIEEGKKGFGVVAGSPVNCTQGAAGTIMPEGAPAVGAGGGFAVGGVGGFPGAGGFPGVGGGAGGEENAGGGCF